MAIELNSSFIPKKDIKRQKKEGGGFAVNVFLLITVIVFLATLLAAIGVLVWSKKIESDNRRALETLERERDNFGLSAIEEFIELNNRISSAEEILNQHISVVSVFEILEEDTLTDIVLTDFSLATQGPDVFVNIGGIAPTYAHVALQSDQYSANNKLKEILFSGVNQDRDGNISFQVNFTMDRDDLLISK